MNGKPFSWDVRKISDRHYHVLKDHVSYRVEHLGTEEGKEVFKVNGNIYQTESVGKFDELLKQMGMERAADSSVNEVKAPMPGMVLSVDSQPGDTVQKGDRLLVLEAMKMENVIKSPTDGTIASVDVEQGKSVEKNQVMVRFS